MKTGYSGKTMPEPSPLHFLLGGGLWGASRFDKVLDPTYNGAMRKNFAGVLNPESEEFQLLKKIRSDRIPVHVAVIMDGNGRWAQNRGLKRIEGHRKGIESAREIVECSARLGISHLTLFTFSTENWKRPPQEIRFLMNMLYSNLISNRHLLSEHGIHLNLLGLVRGLPKKLQLQLEKTIHESQNHRGLQVNLAINYGARAEIVQAIQGIIRDGIPEDQIGEELIQEYLYTRKIPDPDLLIRTSGEFRISNFLLYQLAYTELYFTSTLWPDFHTKEFFMALIDYQNRSRRFGQI